MTARMVRDEKRVLLNHFPRDIVASKGANEGSLLRADGFLPSPYPKFHSSDSSAKSRSLQVFFGTIWRLTLNFAQASRPGLHVFAFRKVVTL